jgi:HKD family nuclease
VNALQSEGALVKLLKTELSRARKFCFGMALITQNGLDLISSSMESCLEAGGRGRVLFGIDLPTEPAAIENLCTIQRKYKRGFELRRFQSGRTFFHPKLSIFTRQDATKAAVIGSSNLTGGGLSTNYETNVFLDDRKVVIQLLEYFDEHFLGAHSRPVSQRWLDQYHQLWTERKKAEQDQRKLRDKAARIGGLPANVPKQIQGHVFAFTGAIAGWPRKRKLYPRVERLGGRIVKKAAAMGSVQCLVHAEILSGRKSTQKLEVAHRKKIPIITEEQFFKLARLK